MAWARKNTGGGRGVENAICVMYAGLGPDAGRAANNTTVEHFADIELVLNIYSRPVSM